jgi:4-amino-4-deoxy-L-arabinose transferase-like glycosyltransferase
MTFRRAGPYLILLLAAIVALGVGWTGFIASDDMLYYAGAHRWAMGEAFTGSDHWTTRLPLMWLFAAMLRLVGENFVAFAATALIPYAALVALAMAAGRREGGARSGWCAALLVATMPVVVANATTVGVDLIEASLLLGGALLLTGAGGRWRGVAAGACFGTAIMCRETALLALVGLVPLFLLGRPVSRRMLLGAGVGLALVLGAEALFQGVMTGDPLRRYAIAFHHDAHIDRAANREGNVLLHPAVDPLLVLLVNDDFGWLFWLAGAAGVSGAWRRASRSLAVTGAMAAAVFVLVAVLYGKLVLNPRYFMLPAIAAALLVGRWLAGTDARGRAALLSVTITSNLLLLGLANAHPRWAVETLVLAAAAHPCEAVAADPVMVRRAAIPLGFAGLHNVRSVPVAGGLLLMEEARAPAGRVVARYPSPPTRVGSIVEAAGLARLVPGALRGRVFAPSGTTVLVRVAR